MLFSTPLFLFLFLPVSLALYFLLGRRLRNTVALLVSLFFYAWGEPIFIVVVLLSAFFDWVMGWLIFRKESAKAKRSLLLAAVAGNIGLLLYYKYTDFFIQSVNTVITALRGGGGLPLLNIALPIGVSFIVFEKITYVVDIYRGEGKPAKSFGSYLLYVLLFPKLLAGPIIKYHEIEQQLSSRTVMLDDICEGMIRFSFGLAKKVLIADALSRIVDLVFNLPPGQLGFRQAWIGLLLFTLQIFFDFSGYSDMAIGIARILGFRLRENFNNPYIAANFTEFWRRWHISLSTWIREYLYIPLGGNRVSVGRTYFNLVLCFFLSGLWHGAHWTFVVWGLYQGFFLVLDRLFWLEASKRIPRFVNIGLCFLLVVLGWVFFRAKDMNHAILYFGALFSGPTNTGSFLYLTNDIPLVTGAGLIISFFPATALCARLVSWWQTVPLRTALSLACAFVLLLLSASRAANATFNPFLYFRF